MHTTRFRSRSLSNLLIVLTLLCLIGCAARSSSPSSAAKSAQETSPKTIVGSDPDMVSDQIAAEADKVQPNQPTFLARKVAVQPDETLIPLSPAVLKALDPAERFSLGLDRYVRQDFLPLHHKRVLVATSRLAIDSEGRHLLQSLMPSRKPMVRRVILFNDELPAAGRTAEIDRIMAAYPEVRVFERTPRNFRLTDTMLEGIDILLIDLPMRAGQFYPEAGFLAGLLQDAALRKIRVIILDRPTPGPGTISDGPVADVRLHGAVSSFYPTAITLGLTTGESAQLMNTQFGIGAELEVVQLQKWARDAGYKPLIDSYERLGIAPWTVYDEWESYMPRDIVQSQLQLIADLAPAGRILAVQKATSEAPASLLVDPAPLSPQQFAESFNQYQVGDLVASVIQAQAGNETREAVLLAARGVLPEPVYGSVALWAIFAKGDPALLPEAGNPGLFGTTLIFDGLREGRHPRDLQRIWRSQAAYGELDTRRKRALIY